MAQLCGVRTLFLIIAPYYVDAIAYTIYHMPAVFTLVVPIPDTRMRTSNKSFENAANFKFQILYYNFKQIKFGEYLLKLAAYFVLPSFIWKPKD